MEECGKGTLEVSHIGPGGQISLIVVKGSHDAEVSNPVQPVSKEEFSHFVFTEKRGTAAPSVFGSRKSGPETTGKTHPARPVRK